MGWECCGKALRLLGSPWDPNWCVPASVLYFKIFLFDRETMGLDFLWQFFPSQNMHWNLGRGCRMGVESGLVLRSLGACEARMWNEL